MAAPGQSAGDTRAAWYAARSRLLVRARHVSERLRRVRALRPLAVAAGKRLVALEMRRLHDTLAATPIAGRYWVWGGLLLGWAREGGVLSNDTADVDFAFCDTDFERMRASLPALRAAGFRLLHAVRNNAGDLSVLVLERSGIHFDFLKLTRVDDLYRYYGSFWSVQIVGEVPAQPLEPFELFGRTWLKSKDHDLELTAMYGDWRTPRSDWQTERDSPAVVAREENRFPYDDPDDLDEHVQPFRMPQA